MRQRIFLFLTPSISLFLSLHLPPSFPLTSAVAVLRGSIIWALMLSVAAVPTSVRAALTLPWLTSVISYIVFFDAGRGEGEAVLRYNRCKMRVEERRERERERAKKETSRPRYTYRRLRRRSWRRPPFRCRRCFGASWRQSSHRRLSPRLHPPWGRR